MRWRNYAACHFVARFPKAKFPEAKKWVTLTRPMIRYFLKNSGSGIAAVQGVVNAIRVIGSVSLETRHRDIFRRVPPVR